METEISSEVKKQITDLIFEGRKIQAIKLLRMESGLDLKDAKGFVDALTCELRQQFPDKFSAGKGAGCGTAAAIFIVLAIAGYSVVFLI